MDDILQAARSYYGLTYTESCTTQLFTNQAGQTCVAFEIPLSNEDFAAIVDRMKAMQEVESQSDIVPLDIEMPDMDSLRASYNALSKAEKGIYGSFSNYLRDHSHTIIEVRDNAPPAAQRIMDKALEQADWSLNTPGALDRKVAHIDTPEEPEPVSMDAVWLDQEEATQAQKQFAIDYCENDGYYVQWAMLTDEQKQKAKEKP